MTQYKQGENKTIHLISKAKRSRHESQCFHPDQLLKLKENKTWLFFVLYICQNVKPSLPIASSPIQTLSSKVIELYLLTFNFGITVLI